MNPPVATVTIYTTDSCGYCVRAKEFLNRKQVAFVEVDVSGDDAARAALVQRSNGQRTVPQIFVGEVHVGGYSDMVALDAMGGFQPLLVAAANE